MNKNPTYNHLHNQLMFLFDIEIRCFWMACTISEILRKAMQNVANSRPAEFCRHHTAATGRAVDKPESKGRICRPARIWVGNLYNHPVLRIRDPVPFWPRIRKRFFRISDPGSQTFMFGSLLTIFWVKSLWFLSTEQLFKFKNKIIFDFLIFVVINKVIQQICFHPVFLSPGSGMDKNQEPG
jgi:hypothetical protein